jgi:hypothetical protein
MSDSSLYTLDEGSSDSDTGQEQHTFLHPWRSSQSPKKVEEETVKRGNREYDMPIIEERYIPHTSAQEYLLMGEMVDEDVDPKEEFDRLVKELGEVFDVRVELIAEINRESSV